MGVTPGLGLTLALASRMGLLPALCDTHAEAVHFVAVRTHMPARAATCHSMLKIEFISSYYPLCFTRTRREKKVSKDVIKVSHSERTWTASVSCVNQRSWPTTGDGRGVRTSGGGTEGERGGGGGEGRRRGGRGTSHPVFPQILVVAKSTL